MIVLVPAVGLLVDALVIAHPVVGNIAVTSTAAAVLITTVLVTDFPA